MRRLAPQPPVSPDIRSAKAAIDAVAACPHVEQRAAALDELGAHVGRLIDESYQDIALLRAIREQGNR